MRLKSSKNYLTIVILTLINICLLLYIYILKRKNSEFLINLQQNVENRISLCDDIIQSFWVKLNAEGAKCNDNVKFKNLNDSVLSMDKIVSSKKVLFFRFFKGNCSVCIRNEFFNLIKLSDEIEPLNIAVISDYDDQSIMELYNEFKPKFRLLRMTNPNEKLVQSIDTLHIPYYFIKKRESDPIKILPLVSKLKSYSSKYLELIKETELRSDY
jgi:hypothetical protein